MISGVNTRELIVGILLEINEEGQPSHQVIRNVLTKYQFLPKQDRAFITRVCEGTLEYQITIDYILNCFSKVKTDKMKPAIREILRSGIYQLKYMDSVPDSAVCNEAVKLAQKRGFYNLKPFVNGVLRTAARQMNEIVYPDESNLVQHLSVKYSMPEVLVKRWLDEYGEDTTRVMLEDFLTERPMTVRCRQYRTDQESVLESIRSQGIQVEPTPYLDYAFYLSGFNHILTVQAFLEGKIFVQDVSSMLVAEVAAPKKGDRILDLCAAPGGKSLHMADKMGAYGMVDARDLTEYKVELIQENIARADAINIEAHCMDATILDEDSVNTADIVLADVPCSGYGVIGKKPDIKYRISESKQEDLVLLQRKILDRASQYVKEGGTLVYSTCTIAREENQGNVEWFLENYPFEAVSLDGCLPEELQSETTKKGYLQLLPGVHKTDGFFIAKFKRKR